MWKLKILFLSFLFLIMMNLSLNAQNKKFIEFEGDLEKGKSYFAEIEFLKTFNEWQTVKPLNLPHHQAGRIEWINLKKFSILKEPKNNSLQRIAFKVVSKKIYQADKNRWNIIYQVKILYLIN